MSRKEGYSEEEDFRVGILNSFLSCPHRDTNSLIAIHKEIQDKDPLFYSHLACWYYKNGDIRDHNEVFASMLITDSYIDNREVGVALFRKHAPFMKNNIVGFIKGKEVVLRKKTGKKIKKNNKSVGEIKNVKLKVGLNKSLPTIFKKDIFKYLKWLELNTQKFDSVFMKYGKDLKSLYFSIGKRAFPTSERAQQILFHGKIPEDSKISIIEELSKVSPVKAAKLIVENKIPYSIAVGAIEKVTPSILVALINNMTSMEVLNNLSSLEEKGAMKNEKIKALIMEKLEKAKKDKNVSALKSKKAISVDRIKDKETIDQLEEVANSQVKKRGVIKYPIAVLVDSSSSMDRSIEVGKNVAVLVSGISESDLTVITFDTMAHEITAKGRTLKDWENAFKPIRASGCTSIGCALDYLIRKDKYVEGIVIITDEGENQSPLFSDVYLRYQKKFKISPSIIIIRIECGSSGGTLTHYLKNEKISFDVLTPKNDDYLGLPGLIPLLTKGSKLDLVYEIMETPLLTRGAFY
jgi:hypothetical protein